MNQTYSQYEKFFILIISYSNEFIICCNDKIISSLRNQYHFFFYVMIFISSFMYQKTEIIELDIFMTNHKWLF